MGNVLPEIHTLTKDLVLIVTTSNGMEIIHYRVENKHEYTTDGDTDMCQTHCMISDMTTGAPSPTVPPPPTHTHTHKKA